VIPRPQFLPISSEQRAARAVRLIVGLVLFGVGLGFMIAADLGLPPWDVLHQGLAEQTDQPIGRMINIVGFVLLMVMVMLREPMGLGTVLNIIVIGVIVDVFLEVVGEPTELWVRWVLVLTGPAIVAIGSGLYIGSAFGPGPRDGIMTALKTRGIAVWKARTGIEAVAFTVGLVLGGSAGFGTIWFLVTIGPLVDLALRGLAFRSTAVETA
jgi:uncharacterized membrane protein YczE